MSPSDRATDGITTRESLAALAYGQTVLARAVQCAGMEWDSSAAHSAIYDTERTADLFCAIVNRWKILTGF